MEATVDDHVNRNIIDDTGVTETIRTFDTDDPRLKA